MFIVVAIIFAISFFTFFSSLGNAKLYSTKTPAHLRLQLRKYWKRTTVSGFTAIASIVAIIAMYYEEIGGWF